MNNIKEVTCTVCPRGCLIKVNTNTNNVSGAMCKRGINYSLNEITNPLRLVQTTIKINSTLINRLPVKVSDYIPKNKIIEVVNYLENITVNPPIKFNQVIIKNILNLNVDVIATREINQ